MIRSKFLTCLATMPFFMGPWGGMGNARHGSIDENEVPKRGAVVYMDPVRFVLTAKPVKWSWPAGYCGGVRHQTGGPGRRVTIKLDVPGRAMPLYWIQAVGYENPVRTVAVHWSDQMECSSPPALTPDPNQPILTGPDPFTPPK